MVIILITVVVVENMKYILKTECREIATRISKIKKPHGRGLLGMHPGSLSRHVAVTGNVFI